MEPLGPLKNFGDTMYANTMNFEGSFTDSIHNPAVASMMIVQPRLSFNTHMGEPVAKPTETLERYEKLLINELANH